jgi:hypothetical protein
MSYGTWIPALLVLALVPHEAGAHEGLAVGKFVAARWSDGNWYYAKITAAKAGSYEIEYVGGGVTGSLGKEDIRALRAGLKYKAGDGSWPGMTAAKAGSWPSTG